ncbi:hypothetical protein R6Q57_007447 [Mikania cordata]
MGMRERLMCEPSRVSLLVELKDTGFVTSHAALKVESGKVDKHKKACLENEHVLTPFAFDAFGFLASDAVNFLNQVQRVMNSNITAPKTQNIVFSRIGFVIQKRVVTQLVAHLLVRLS